MKGIVAINKFGYIGKDNTLMWKCKKDLEHFKKETMGCKLLVGRTTYENMPKLPGREMIVVGKGYNTLKEALAQKPDWVIGGAQLYRSVAHLCTEFHISIIDNEMTGDVRFYREWIREETCDIIEYNFKEDIIPVWKITKGKGERRYIKCNKEDRILHPEQLCGLNGLGMYSGDEMLKELYITIGEYLNENQI